MNYENKFGCSERSTILTTLSAFFIKKANLSVVASNNPER
jgi:hypothetical protein